MVKIGKLQKFFYCNRLPFFVSIPCSYKHLIILHMIRVNEICIFHKVLYMQQPFCHSEQPAFLHIQLYQQIILYCFLHLRMRFQKGER